MMDRVASPPPSATNPAQLRRLAQSLESSFAAELLRSARPSAKEGLGGRGTGGQAFDSFLDDALGDALVRQGGLGLSGSIQKEIGSRATMRGER